MRSADPSPAPRAAAGESGFSLLELVVALSIFAIIVVNVLADREKSIHIAADANVIQTVRYLAQSKMDEIRHTIDDLSENDGGDFSDLNTDWQDFSAYTWELEVARLVAIGAGESSDEYLFTEDEEESNFAPSGDDEEELAARYVRRLTLTVRFEPNDEPRPDLSIRIVTFVPDAEEEEGGL